MSWNKNPPPYGVNPQYSSFNSQSNTFSPPQRQNQYVEAQHRAGVPGGGWDEGEEELRIQRPTQASRNPVISPPSRPNPPQEIPISNYEMEINEEGPITQARPEIKVNTAPLRTPLTLGLQPGPYERKLIEDICMPSGARVKPSEKDLLELSKKCTYLPCEIIGGLLLQQLDNPPKALKALFVIDRLITDYQTYFDFANENRYRIESAGHSQAHLRAIQTIIGKLDRTGARAAGITTSAPSNNPNSFDNILEL